MYKAFTSLWCKSPSPLTSSTNTIRLSPDTSIDEDGWILVSDTASKITSSDDKNSIMTNSWIASPPLVTRDESPVIPKVSTPNIHHFNPIENLLIEHASMSVYEQIASRARPRRQRKLLHDTKLDEQTERTPNDEQDDDDDQVSVVLQYASQHPNLSSIYCRTPNASLSRSTNSSVSTLESSTSSLVAHHRHLHRIHQRRRRHGSGKTPAKLLLTSNTNDSKATFNKIIERQRLNSARTPKLVLHQPSRSNH